MSKKSKNKVRVIDPEALCKAEMKAAGLPESALPLLRQVAGNALATELHPAMLLAKSGLSTGSAGASAIGGQVKMPTAVAPPMQPGVAPAPTFPATPAARPSGILDQALKTPTPDVDPNRSGGPGHPPVRDDNHDWMLALMEGATLAVSGGPTGDAGIPGSGSIQGGRPTSTTPRPPTVNRPIAGKSDVTYDAVRGQAGDSLSKALDAAELRDAPPEQRALLRDVIGRVHALQAHPAMQRRR